MTKTSNQIQAYILKMGSKLTNAELAERLGTPRRTFAAVLANMKTQGKIANNFLKTDLQKNSKSTSKSKNTTSSRSTKSNPVVSKSNSRSVNSTASKNTSSSRNTTSTKRVVVAKK